MHQLETFICKQFRPEIVGGRLDEAYQALFQLDKDRRDGGETSLAVNAICFGPRKDNVLLTLEHAIKAEDGILIFYYEDIHRRWSYVSDNHEQYFLYRKNDREQYKIQSSNLYIRGVYVEPQEEHWSLLGDFFKFVELWEGFVLCAPKQQMPNESKLFQLNNSLRKAAQKTDRVSLGKSYVVKGENSFNSLRKDKPYIVKSLSGVRSIVVDENDYKQWSINNLNNIPVLFQEKVAGNDLRAHVIDQTIFLKKSNLKVNIDYRYDKNFFKLSTVTEIESEFNDFCFSVAKEEDNQLLGIDFIQTHSGYVVLEANPSPGWSAYHPYNGVDEEPFIIELLKVLKSD